MEEVPDNEEEPQEQIVAHLMELNSEPDSFLSMIADIDGALRQSQIWSVYYYAAEVSYCVRNTWFTPNRFFRTGDVYSAKTHHLSVIPQILKSESDIEMLFLKHLRIKTPDTLTDFDRVLDAFFRTTGYKIVRNLRNKSSGVCENSTITPHQHGEAADLVAASESSPERKNDSTAARFSRSIYTSVVNSPAYEAIERPLRDTPVLISKVRALALLAAHMRLVCELKHYYPQIASPQLYQAIAEETERLLNESPLPTISLGIIFPDPERRRQAGAMLGVNSVDALNSYPVSPGTAFGLRLIDDVFRFTLIFESKGIGNLTHESVVHGSGAVLGYLISLVRGFRDLNEPVVHALGDLAIAITRAVFTATTSIASK